MRLLLLSLFMMTLGSAFASSEDEAISFKNVREGKSFYSSRSQRTLIKKTLKAASAQEITSVYEAALKKQNPKSVCAYSLNSAISEGLLEKGRKVDFKGVVHVLRSNDEIDDVVAKIMLSAHEVKSTKLYYPKTREDFIYPDDSDTNKQQLEVIGNFEKRLSKAACFDEAYRSLYSEIFKIDKTTKPNQLEALYFKALEEKMISPAVHVMLEQARVNKVENSSLTLATYSQKIKTLRLQYPLRDITERSDFTAVKVKKMPSSRRQKLFETYSDLQIIMMGNVIKKLRQRLEYDGVEIHGIKNGEVLEVISLDPMERFRFAIKSLRKEMSLLSLNSYFNGRSPDYIDLMVASYEIGIIPASELETVASLEEIWNPKKTFWDKAGVWIKTFSSVATIVIPPPYGFIPALVIVVIEATVGQKKKTGEDTTVLF